MSLKRYLNALPFLRRATTQTWMILTFALFVGIAVVTVGLYSMLVLRTEIRETARETLHNQARNLAEQLAQETSHQDRGLLVRSVSRITDFRITVVHDGVVEWDVQENRSLNTPRAFFARPEVTGAAESDRPNVGFAERTDHSGRRTLYAAVYLPESDLLVRVAQPEPTLYVLVERAQLTLIGGMVLALVLALVGSWIASYQVTQPLKAIRRSARRINEGHLDETITVDSRAAEFQDLADSLNSMAERFRKDISELQRITQIQNEFIGNVSHEVKNPIFAVSGYLEALGSSNLPDNRRKKYAEKGLMNLQRLNNLFSDLIEIARLGYREDIIQPEVIDLGELVGEVSELLEPKAEEKDLDLVVRTETVYVYADRSRIRQVLINLLDNGIAYTSEGVVRCRYRRRQDKVRIKVIDTGRGIEEDHLDRIFERFYRVDTARSRREGGTGLGLSIVQQILKAHGESIHVESTVGRGTRFWFDLPWVDPAEVGDEEENTEESPEVSEV